MSQLPPDVTLLICEELGYQRAFGTLFNVALSCRRLAGPALLWMYRVHEQASIRIDDSTETRTWKAEPLKTVSKWALQWRSIIMSSLGKTAYPYCLYIRSLDLTNLSELLSDPAFQRVAQGEFFADDMRDFLFQTIAIPRLKIKKIDAVATIQKVGESIAQFTSESVERNGGTASLEELSGDISKEALLQWIKHFQRLKSLTIWTGSNLDESLADVIKSNCPDFQSLSVWEGTGHHVDANLAAFFERLPSDTLRSFSLISYNYIGPETFLSLNNHHASLRYLMLGSLEPPAIKALSYLKGCDALEMIDLQDARGTLDLEATENDIYLEIIAWLTSCKNLKTISLTNFVNGPKILTSVCLQEAIKLQSLKLVKYMFTGNQDFHRSLTQQPSLETLYLKSDSEGSFRDDLDTFAASVRELKNLTVLNIVDTPDYWSTSEIQIIALSLSKLEEFSVGGYSIKDEVFPAIACLPFLRSMAFHGETYFTSRAILKYIDELKPTNTGLQLSVMYQATGQPLTDGEVHKIRKALAKKVGGRFDFEMQREATDSDFSTYSD